MVLGPSGPKIKDIILIIDYFIYLIKSVPIPQTGSAAIDILQIFIRFHFISTEPEGMNIHKYFLMKLENRKQEQADKFQ